MNIDSLVAGVLAGQRADIGRAITLVESRQADHFEAAAELLSRLTPHAGRSQRIGLTGVPGVGKSTFIERFGCIGSAGSPGSGAGGESDVESNRDVDPR